MNTKRRVDILNFNFFDWSGERVFTGGAERYVYDLAVLCRSLGLQPRLIQNASIAFERTFNGVDVIGVPATSSMDFQAMSTAFAALTRDAALIIASPLELACRLDLSPPAIGINHGIHWDSPTNRRSTFDLARYRYIFDALDVVSQCVCVDTNFGNWLKSIDGRRLSLLEYIPNYVDSKQFRPGKKRFDQKRINVLFPRRLCEERGFHDVLEAFDALLLRHPEIALHLCGGGLPAEEQLAQEFLARHPGRARWSELEGEEMPRTYAESHIVLVPSIFSEGESLSCIEAMACNNAVIATTVGGLPNLIIDGYNGLLIRPGARALTAAVERLLADRILLGNLARNAIGVSAALSRTQWEERWTSVLSTSLPLRLKLSHASANRSTTQRLVGGGASQPASRGELPSTLDSDGEAARRARHWMHEALRQHDFASFERAQLIAERDDLAAKGAVALVAQATIAIERDGALAQLNAMRVEHEHIAAAIGAALLDRDSANAARAAATTERDVIAGERDAAYVERHAAKAAMESAITQREAEVAAKDRALAAQADALANRDAAVAERDAALAKHEATVVLRDAAIDFAIRQLINTTPWKRPAGTWLLNETMWLARLTWPRPNATPRGPRSRRSMNHCARCRRQRIG